MTTIESAIHPEGAIQPYQTVARITSKGSKRHVLSDLQNLQRNHLSVTEEIWDETTGVCPAQSKRSQDGMYDWTITAVPWTWDTGSTSSSSRCIREGGRQSHSYVRGGHNHNGRSDYPCPSNSILTVSTSTRRQNLSWSHTQRFDAWHKKQCKYFWASFAQCQHQRKIVRKDQETSRRITILSISNSIQDLLLFENYNVFFANESAYGVNFHSEESRSCIGTSRKSARLSLRTRDITSSSELELRFGFRHDGAKRVVRRDGADTDGSGASLESCPLWDSPILRS